MDVRYLSTLLLLLTITSCGGGSNSDTPDLVRPSNTSCLAGNSQTYTNIRHVNAFPNLAFSQPVGMIPAPTGNTVYVIERSGTIKAFDNNPAVATTTEFANITSLVSTAGEGGLLGMAFDPNFNSNGYVYLSYTAAVPDNQQLPNTRVMWSRISRFSTNLARTAIINASETNLLQIDQPYSNHNGGQIAFDNNGYLFIGLGDGGSGNDPNQNGQDVSTLLGSMLRIDPSIPDAGRGLAYSIPASNPFSSNASCADGACPEIYAWGLRNPWRWSFDRSTYDLWVGDVGQGSREEIDRIQVGKNYGWACYEGTLFNSSYGGSCPNGLTHEAPVFEYTRSDGNSVTGGYIYRGNNLTALRGSYVFSDYGSGQVWALSDLPSSPTRTNITSSSNLVVSMAEDADGELYLVHIDTGQIHILEPDPTSMPAAPFASQLSQTGCANNTDPRLPASGMIPYEINAPLWSDNATKSRWIALPDSTTINIENDHDWTFPVGSVLRKDFYLAEQIVETRLLALHTDGVWAGYSYEWNNQQTDATLLDTEKTILVNSQNWTFPSQAQCLQCHTSAAGRSLGTETAQLNKTITHPLNPSTQLNQINYLNLIGMFRSDPGNPDILPSLSMYTDTNSSPESIARGYLHSNCSHCHRIGGPAPGNIDFHYSTLFSDINVCNIIPSEGNVLGANLLFAPGNIDDSIIYQRMRSLSDNQRMPPTGTNLEDVQGSQIIADWINSVAICP